MFEKPIGDLRTAETTDSLLLTITAANEVTIRFRTRHESQTGFITDLNGTPIINMKTESGSYSFTHFQVDGPFLRWRNVDERHFNNGNLKFNDAEALRTYAAQQMNRAGFFDGPVLLVRVGSGVTVGQIYERGQRARAARNHEETFMWFKAAANLGHAAAMATVAQMYEKGQGTYADTTLAISYFKAAGAHGIKVATELARTLEAERAVRNKLAASRAEQTAVKAQLDAVELAKVCVDSVQAQNYRGAFPICRSAAESGVDIAQNILGELYQYGRGVPANRQEALVWYHKAADQGEPAAQTRLGILYRIGLAGRRDPVLSAKYFRLAADGGYAPAMMELAQSYETGDGVPTNNVLAYMWFTLAASNSMGDESLRRKALAMRRGNVSDFGLTAAQIADAERRARAWKPKPR
jgi:TPR repeat protein